MRIAITGHRPDKLGGDYSMESPLVQKIVVRLQELIDLHKPSQMISGMALGVDTIWALLALQNSITLIAAIPFKGQESKWIPESVELYLSILEKATVVVISPGGYSASKMQIRNEYMVDNCDLLIAVWDGTPGGTANCVKYAKSKGKEIIRINPKDFR